MCLGFETAFVTLFFFFFFFSLNVLRYICRKWSLCLVCLKRGGGLFSRPYPPKVQAGQVQSARLSYASLLNPSASMHTADAI